MLLEVGAGYGTIARWLAERVAPTGSVIATDIDPRLLTDMPAGVDVHRLDIRHDDESFASAPYNRNLTRREHYVGFAWVCRVGPSVTRISSVLLRRRSPVIVLDS
jgi:16S rRNA A1518/A1519 N6-dimethyltransferase RsmA/KsgA/DIM1 with predicted DNA glycosylase/AP lyase activity